MTYIAEIESKEKGIEYFETVIRYLFGAGKDLTEDEYRELLDQVKQTYPEGSGVMMTLAERFMAKGEERGLAKGRAEGKVEGIRLERIDNILRLLRKKLGEAPAGLREELVDLDLSTLDTILDNIFEYEKIEDVWEYMDR